MSRRCNARQLMDRRIAIAAAVPIESSGILSEGLVESLDLHMLRRVAGLGRRVGEVGDRPRNQHIFERRLEVHPAEVARQVPSAPSRPIHNRDHARVRLQAVGRKRPIQSRTQFVGSRA